MAKFLNSSGITYHLEELIKNARDRLILISPFLKFNDRMRELLEDKDRLKIDIRIVYGKNELQPEEINWLRGLQYVRTSFCKNLHAKCYMSESQAIITSMNLYEFSQVNNNEMGILIEREVDGEIYRDTYEESQRLIRISDELKISVEKIERQNDDVEDSPDVEDSGSLRRLSTTKLAQQNKLATKEMFGKLESAGLIERNGDQWKLAAQGITKGGIVKSHPKYGEYIAWPENLVI